MAGGRIDIEVGIDAKSAPAQLERAMQGTVATAGKIGSAMGLALGAAAIGSAINDVIALGNEYTSTLNTMQAVSSATADQMAQVSERARQLGTDIDLPNTSASDAAAAMTELAKGGFDVQQAMTAAKGTLQLAAAAQIDAATAATIQSQALQAFGLNADYAATAADVLANASNASSAEIVDVAYGLQAGGTVAAQFGLTLEDTAAGLGMLANAGIQGSDAGTLLKSALLALTDQGKPAQEAIAELGLTVYDAEGKFVGLRSLLDQLGNSAASMSEEQYQAATATLFGSDAMRLAGIAAQDGVARFDAMRAAIDRQGAAADVAAAKTQGLPGAFAAIGNSVEEIALGAYDVIKGPLEEALTGLTEGLQDAGPAITRSLEGAVGTLGTVASAIGAIPGPLKAAGAAFVAIEATGANDTIGGWVEKAQEYIAGFREEMALQGELAAAAAEETDGLGEAVGGLEDPLGTAAEALATFEARSPGVARVAGAYRDTTARVRDFADQQRAAAGQSGRLMGALRSATAGVSTFGSRAAGVGVAGLSAMRVAGGSLVSVLGGPWMVGLMAASAAVSAITSKFAAAEARQDALRESADALATQQRDLAKSFAESSGAMSDSVFSVMAAQVGTLRGELQTLSDTDTSALGMAIAAIKGEDTDGFESFDAAMGDLAATQQAAEGARDAIESLKLSDEELAVTITGSAATFDAMVSLLRQQGEGGEEAARRLGELREEFLTARETAANTTPGFFDLTEAVRVLADETATAESRINAMKTALDVLSGKPIALADATQDYDEVLRRIQIDMNGGVDAAAGYGAALLDQSGALSTATENGSRLRDSLVSLRDSSLAVAQAAADQAFAEGATVPEAQRAAQDAMARNVEALEALAGQYGLTVEQVEGLAAAEGLVPDQIALLVALQGADDAEQQLTIIGQLLGQVGAPVDIPVTALTDEARQKLIDLGLVVEDDINGKPGIVRISAPNQQALDAIKEVQDRRDALKDKKIVITMEMQERERRQFQNRVDASTSSSTSGYATGGRPDDHSGYRLPSHGPGTATRDGILGVSASGIPTARVDGGEWIVNRWSSNRYHSELQAINAGTFPKLPGYQGGGFLPAMTAWIRKWHPAMSITSTYRKGDPGYHGRYMAVDASNGSDNTPEMLALAEDLAAVAPNLLELIHSAPGFTGNIKDGANVGDGVGMYGTDTMAQHRNHVHAAGDFEIDYDTDPADYRTGDAGSDEMDSRSGADRIVDAIVAEGESRGITDKGIVAALSAALVESELRILANPTVPESMDIEHDGTGTDHDSVGPLQQRGSWGSVADRMDPRASAGLFFDRLDDFDYDAMDPGAAAQKVQVSAFPEKYAERVAEAEELLRASRGRGSDNYDTDSGTSSSSRRSSWTARNEAQLESARVSVTQAEEARDKVYANDKKTDADRRQADLRVEKAELRVKELEAKKRDAKDGKKEGPAPEAPELDESILNASDEDLERMDLDQAVEDARLRRNEVYADEDATDADKTKADIALARALKRQKEGPDSESSGSGTAKTIKGRLQQFGSDIFGVFFDAAMEQVPFGLGQSRWLTTEWPDLSQREDGESAATLESIEELLGEQKSKGDKADIRPEDQRKIDRLTPGTPEWFREIFRALERPPTVLRDTGGPLPTGTAALNLSGDTEWVLTSAQRRAYERDQKELAALRAERSGPGNGVDLSDVAASLRSLVDNPPVVQQTTYNGYDLRESQRRETVRQRQAALTYARRGTL